MSLGDSLAKLMVDDDATPVDVLMALMDEKNVQMTANIKNISIMHRLKLYQSYFGNPDPNNKAYSPKCAMVAAELYRLKLLHSVVKGGLRAQQIIDGLTGMLVFLGMNPNSQQGGSPLTGEKKGLFGRRR